MDKNGPTIYESEACKAQGHVYANYTRRGNTLYMHVYYWPGETLAANWVPFFNPPSVVAIGGLRAKVFSARLYASGTPVKFEQGDQYVRFTGLPIAAPDSPSPFLPSSATGACRRPRRRPQIPQARGSGECEARRCRWPTRASAHRAFHGGRFWLRPLALACGFAD